jgi:hypothetical protein
MTFLQVDAVRLSNLVDGASPRALPIYLAGPISFHETLQNRRSGPWLATLLLLAAGGVRIWQFAGAPSLWFDEILLARNILQRPLLRLLTEPLASRQVAPAGFLALERLAVVAFGPNDRALRLVPFVGALLALPLFWRVTTHVLAEPARTTARVLFAFSAPFIWYGSEVKQYSTDVLISLVLTCMALTLPAKLARGRWPVVALLAGPIACWLSTPAALLLGGLGAGLLLEAIQGRWKGASWRPVLGVLAVWLVGAGLSAGFSLRVMSPDTHDFMQHYWREAFLPLPPWHVADLLWPIRQAESIFGDGGLQYGWYVVPLALGVIGLVTLVRLRRYCGVALAAPIVAAFLAAVAHVYPFSGRLMAFTMPALVIGLAEGIEQVARRVWNRTGVPPVVIRLLLIVPVLGPVVLSPPVYRVEETAPVLQYIASHVGPADAVYVYYGARPAVDYYGPRFSLPVGNLEWGGCYRQDPRAYLTELDRLRGRPRVWVLLAHAIEAERSLVRDYLSVIGMVSDSLVIRDDLPLHRTPGAAAYRFDLSDPARLHAADSDHFPVPAPSTRECGTVAREP